MNEIMLDKSTKQLLTDEKGALCDLNGDPIPTGKPPIESYTDILTGSRYAKIAEQLPSDDDPDSKRRRETLQGYNPIHYVSSDATLFGWFAKLKSQSGSAQVAA